MDQKQLFFKDPRAGSFTIFGDIPVSHTTGVPDISIPLFTLESHGFEIPVTLKYHLAMVKPPYDYTNVATGWVLDVGGTITQEVKALDDLYGLRPQVFRTDIEANTQVAADQEYLDKAYRKEFDSENDVFNFTFIDKAGKFIVQKSATPGKYNIKPLTASHLIGTVNIIPDSPYPTMYTFQNIQLTDDRGYNYLFRDIELGKMGGIYSKSYFLNEIRTSNNIPLYTYEYSNFGPTGHLFVLQNLQVIDDYGFDVQWYYGGTGVASCGITAPSYSSWAISPTPISNEAGKTVKKITFENGTLEFTLTPNNRYINELVLKDKNGSVIKTISFDVAPNLSHRLLSKVSIKDNAQNTIEAYTLNYNESSVDIALNTVGVDYWGYLQGSAEDNGTGSIAMDDFNFTVRQNILSIISQSSLCYCTNRIDTITKSGPNREPNLYLASTYTLSSIRYPTGGRTEFTYGLNQYAFYTYNYQNGSNVPSLQSESGAGLRIEKITNYDANNILAGFERYEYEPGETDFLPRDSNQPPSIYNHEFRSFSICGYDVLRWRVREFPYSKMPNVSDNRVRYKRVTKYSERPDGTGQLGKTVYDYTYYTPNLFEEDYNNWFISEQRDHISGGLLTKETVYKKTGETYDPIREDVYAYRIDELWREKNLYLNRWNFYTGDGNSLGWNMFNTLGWQALDAPGFRTVYYDNIAGAFQLIRKTTTDYSDNGAILTQQDYEYGDGLDKYMTKESTTTSDQGTKETTYKYAYTSEYASQAPYNTMIEKNVIAEPVEIRKQYNKGGTTNLLSSFKFNYGQFGQDVYRLASTEEAQGDTPPETRFIYSYDSQMGNMIATQKKDGPKTSYIWAYNSSYPIASAINANTTEIFHTSFEETGTLAGQQACRTGKYYFNGSSYTIPTNQRPVGTNLKMTFWYYTAAGGWQFQPEVTYSPTVSKSGATRLDEIRVYPSGARMSTYTYDPIIGLTSQCDANNKVTYYEYDAFGRLQVIKDDLGNIVKTYEYHYKR